MSNNKIMGIKRELEEILKKHRGFLRPGDVVEYAKNKNTDLHKHFCWDDTEAAKKYRLQQASFIIRSVKVRIQPNPREDKTVSLREYVSLPSDRGGDGYRHISSVLTEDDLRLQFIESVQSEFDCFREKLKAVSAVAYKRSESVKREIERARLAAAKKVQRASA